MEWLGAHLNRPGANRQPESLALQDGEVVGARKRLAAERGLGRWNREKRHMGVSAHSKTETWRRALRLSGDGTRRRRPWGRTTRAVPEVARKPLERAVLGGRLDALLYA